MDVVLSDEDSELLVRWLCDRILRTRTSVIERKIVNVAVCFENNVE